MWGKDCLRQIGEKLIRSFPSSESAERPTVQLIFESPGLPRSKDFRVPILSDSQQNRMGWTISYRPIDPNDFNRAWPPAKGFASGLNGASARMLDGQKIQSPEDEQSRMLVRTIQALMDTTNRPVIIDLTTNINGTVTGVDLKLHFDSPPQNKK